MKTRQTGNRAAWTALSLRELATANGVTVGDVKDWIAQGCPRSADGTFDLPCVIAWRLQRAAEDESARWNALANRLWGPC